MKAILSIVSLLLCLNVYANFEPANVFKYSVKVDSNFLQNCIDNLKEYQVGTVACEVLEVPEGMRILQEGSFVGVLNYLIMWSTTSCPMNNSDRLYLRKEKNKLLIAVTDKSCLEIMKEKVNDTQLSNKKSSIYLIRD